MPSFFDDIAAVGFFPEGGIAPSLMGPPQLAQAQPASGADEMAFQSGIRGTDWFSAFVQKYGEEPDLNTKDYDYRKAWAAGLRPEPDPYDDNFPHWPSALPSGEMLKAEDHPTAWKEHFMRMFGVNPDALPPQEVQRLLMGI